MNARTQHHRIASRLSEIWSDINYAQHRMIEVNRAVRPRSGKRTAR